ncbi:MAG: DUF47 family protein [Deltaproteobacteria bacterium]|nr:DUF47 family protein [Deltaproteobacteria bacterium]
MASLFRRDESIKEKLERYFDRCDAFFTAFEKACKAFRESGAGPGFDAAVDRAHSLESELDDIRREIELTLYGKALLPDSRGDMLGLLEAYDQLFTAAERVLFDLQDQRMAIPEDFQVAFEGLIDKNLEVFYLLAKTVDALLNNPRVTLHLVKEVDAKESESDRLERALVRSIFSSTKLDKGSKLELRSLVERIGHISDLAEHISDRIGIVAIKRKI